MRKDEETSGLKLDREYPRETRPPSNRDHGKERRSRGGGVAREKTQEDTNILFLASRGFGQSELSRPEPYISVSASPNPVMR